MTLTHDSPVTSAVQSNNSSDNLNFSFLVRYRPYGPYGTVVAAVCRVQQQILLLLLSESADSPLRQLCRLQHSLHCQQSLYSQRLCCHRLTQSLTTETSGSYKNSSSYFQFFYGSFTAHELLGIKQSETV